MIQLLRTEFGARILVGAICCAVLTRAAGFSWQKPHAKVLPNGGLEWAPEPFAFDTGDSVRYIDYENGNDGYSGTKRGQPWKHHPWDPKAVAEAKACVGIHTYVFKRGVVYRGEMRASESGKPGNPIRLTSDPTWGYGDAYVYGSARITGMWKRVRTTPLPPKAEEGAGAPVLDDGLDLLAGDDDEGENPLGIALETDQGPGIPEPHRVWYVDLGTGFDRDPDKAKLSALWRLDGDKATRLHIARDPNWTITDPNDPTSDWYRWETFDGVQNEGWLADKKHLLNKDPDFLDGATVWTQHAWLMGTVHRARIQSYSPLKGALYITSSQGSAYRGGYQKLDAPVGLHDRVRYFIEDVRGYLDSPGEYWFDSNGPFKGRLYLRPLGDTNPNEHLYEAAVVRCPIQIFDQQHIEISGLAFRFNDPEDGTYGWPPQVGASPCVRVIGNCCDITVRNCSFYHVANAVVAFPRPGDRGGPYNVWRKEIGDYANDVMDGIRITDNDVQHAEKAGAILVTGTSETTKGDGYGRLLRVEVMRNRVVDTGFRPGPWGTSSVPAISVVLPETAEIAGNIVDTSWGNGVFTLGGKKSGAVNDVSLVRILIHHNQIDNTMLGCNDYGGLEIFQGGPAYIYNNISRNSVGTKTFTGHELGYNLYLDGAFKVYSFNNILGGNIKPDDPGYYGHCGYFMVFGFLNHLFNNTIHHFEYGLNGSSGNRSCILGNVIMDCSTSFMGQNRPGDASMNFGGDTGEMGRIGIPTMAYGSNVFWGQPKGGRKGEGAFGFVGGTKTGLDGKAEVYTGDTIEELSTALEEMKCRVSSIGVYVDRKPLVDPEARDYRPVADSAVRDRGVKFFLPWGLSRMVGEWNFYRSETTPEVVLGEHFYMQDEHIERSMYYFIPRNDLTVSSCTPADYVSGPLEDWIEGALCFDGNRVAVLSHADMTRDMTYPLKKKGKNDPGEVHYDGSRRKTLDMDTSSFLIEAHFRTQPEHAAGLLAGKMDQAGYALHIGADGGVVLLLRADCARAEIACPARVNDGQWHHVLAEVDRVARVARVFVDGQQGVSTTVVLPPDASLANAADFIVGRGLVGAIDFLRVCRGTLADAKTTIEELYAWEFDGPHLRDFTGREPVGRRDAGAIELSE